MDNKRRVVGRNLSDLVNNPQDYLTVVANELPNTVREYAADPMNFVGGGIGKIAYHGSPHKFDKFSLDKIGTGEGAQAYGHGLYLAETPEVAKEYAKNLSTGGKFLKVGDREIKPLAASSKWTNEETAAANLIDAGGDFDKAIRRISNQYEKPTPLINEIERLRRSGATLVDPGNLYKTDIPDEAVARFLDWDKPLSQQAPEVQAALEQAKNKQLRAMLDYAKVPYSEMAGGEAKTMGEAFRLLNLNLQGKSSADSAKASALLAKQGIPGIRYLDGGSRSAGQGSSNFVVFDPEMIRILERNGQSTGLQPWQPGEWRPINDLLNVRTD